MNLCLTRRLSESQSDPHLISFIKCHTTHSPCRGHGSGTHHYWNSNNWGWQNSHQSAVIAIIDQLVIELIELKAYRECFDGYRECPDGAVREINLRNPRLLPTLQCTLQCMGHAQSASQVPISFRWSNWKVRSTLLCSINRPWRTDTRLSNTL